MHYLVYVFTENGADREVKKALQRYQHTKWDWYKIGGGWAGLLGEGGTFKVSEVLGKLQKKLPYAFVTDDLDWIEEEIYIPYAGMTWKEATKIGCSFQPNPGYARSYKAILEEFKDGFVTVVDCHN